MPILHGADLSPFVRKVRFALAIKQIAHEQIPVIPFAKTDEFLALSPLGKIPVYQLEVCFPTGCELSNFFQVKRSCSSLGCHVPDNMGWHYSGILMIGFMNQESAPHYLKEIIDVSVAA